MTRTVLTLIVGATAVSGASCIQLQAPKNAIVIDLNVRIDQEVRVRLEGVAEDLIEDNPDIF